MRLTRIYTREGDDGTTGLASGARVGKEDPQVEAYGEVDELNALLGLALASGLSTELAEVIRRVQSELFNLGGEFSMLGGPPDRRPPQPLIQPRHIEALERECDRFNADLPPLENFILPGGVSGAAVLHVARTVCRRAERRAVALSRTMAVPPDLIHYLNRLGDLLFIAARFQNQVQGSADILWDTSL